MIIGGQCGTFNPLLLQCLQEVSDQVRKPEDGHNGLSQYEVRKATEELLRREELTASDRTLQLLEHERMKYSFFAAMSGEIQFEFTLSPPMITLSSWGAGGGRGGHREHLEGAGAGGLCGPPPAAGRTWARGQRGVHHLRKAPNAAPGLWPGRAATVLSSPGHGFTGYGFTVYGFPGYGCAGYGCAGYGKPGAIKY